MSWPFSNVIAPNFKSGISLVEVPEVEAAVPNAPGAAQLWIMGMWVINNSDAERALTLTDGAGEPVLPANVAVPAGGFFGPIEVPFMPIVGLRWVASGPGVMAKIWGYK